MRLIINLICISSLVFSEEYSNDTLRQRKLSTSPITEFPELSNLLREPDDLIGRWVVMRDYYSSYISVSSDSGQLIKNPGQFHGYIPFEEGMKYQKVVFNSMGGMNSNKREKNKKCVIKKLSENTDFKE